MNSNYTSSPTQGSPAMIFNKYPELPKELRLQIIEEAIKPFNRKNSHNHYDAHLSHLASTDLEWNQTIERKLFKAIRLDVEDIVTFKNIYSTRQALLSNLRLKLNLYDVPTSVLSDQQFVVDALAQLFDIMKDWTPERARGQHGLIQLEICVVPRIGSTFSTVSCDLGNLPDAQIIGAFSENPHSENSFQLHRTTLSTLHTKLPNLHCARLPLQLGASLHSTIESASRALETLHATKQDLTNLDVVAHGFPNDRLLGRSNWMTVTKSVTPLISRWRDSLVCLTLNHPVDVPHFLLNAGNVTWPNLKAMNLSGLLDEPHNEPSQTIANINEGCGDLFEGLVAALPSMSKLTTIRVCLRPPRAWDLGFTLSMDFRTWMSSWDCIRQPDFCSVALPNQGPLDPCSDSPGPVSASAVAVLQNIPNREQPIELPGDLLSELQDTVRRYRQLELAIFNCRDCRVGVKDWQSAWTDGIPCKQWNPQTRTWDPAFWNDMDMLIFQMGKYWEWKAIYDYSSCWPVEENQVLRWWEQNLGLPSTITS